MPIADRTSTLVARIAYARSRRIEARKNRPRVRPPKGAAELLLVQDDVLPRARQIRNAPPGRPRRALHRNADFQPESQRQVRAPRGLGSHAQARQYSPGKGIELDAGFRGSHCKEPCCRSCGTSRRPSTSPSSRPSRRRSDAPSPSQGWPQHSARLGAAYAQSSGAGVPRRTSQPERTPNVGSRTKPFCGNWDGDTLLFSAGFGGAGAFLYIG